MIPKITTKSVNINRNGRSSSVGMIGHDQSECTVSLGRNTQMRFRENTEFLVFRSTTSKTTPFDTSKAWRKALDESGIGHCRFHDLRHSAASNLVRAGRSLFEVGTLLGHSSPQMTQRYSHLAVKDTIEMVDLVMGELT